MKLSNSPKGSHWPEEIFFNTYKKVLLTVLSATLLLTSCSKETESVKFTSIPIKTGSFKKFVYAKGTVKPEVNEPIMVPMNMWGTIETMIPEGTVIKAGTPVAKINVREFIEAYSDFAEFIETSKIEAEKANASLPIEILKLEIELNKKANELKEKKFNLQLIEKGPVESEVARVEKDLNQSGIKLAYLPVEKKKLLHEKGFISEDELNNTELEYETALTEQKKAKISKFQNTPEYKVNELNEARLLHDKSKLDFQINKLENQAQQSSVKVRAQNSEYKYLRYKARYDRVKEKIDLAEIVSPIDGIVIYPKIWGWQKPHIGMEVWGGFSFLNVAKINKLKIETKINELEIINVKEGLPVEITVSSMPGKTLNGKVAKVSKLAKYLNERNPEGLKYFDVDINLNEKVQGLKVNMNVEIKVIDSAFDKAFYVPLEAVTEEKKKSYVYFDENNKPVKKEVKIKETGKDYAILDGTFTGKEKFYLSY